MNRSARLRMCFAAGILVAAGVAGWCSVGEPDKTKTRAAIPVLPARTPPAIAPPGAQTTSANAQGAALADLERELRAVLDPAAGSYNGARLMELCKEEQATNLPGPNPATSYVQAWAAQNPREVFEWFRRRGGFLLPAAGNVNYGFIPAVFYEWAKKDPAAAAAAALACPHSRDRAEALVQVIGMMRKTDPARAAALAAENIAILKPDRTYGFNAVGSDYRETWDFLRALPAGGNRDGLLARYFDDIVRYHGKDCAQLWKEMPDELRRGIVAGDFSGMNLGSNESGEGAPATLDGLNDLRRAQIEATGDPDATRTWLKTGAGEWAERDPAAAIAWALEHLKGEQRVEGTSKMFSAGATRDFDTTLREWQALPDGVLRARAAGSIAAGAPAARREEVDALLESLSTGDRAIAASARKTAESERHQRESLKEMFRSLRSKG